MTKEKYWLLGILCVLSVSAYACVPFSEGLNSLAILYKQQGKYAEAEPLYMKALKIREESLGPEHPKVAAILNNLGNLYRAQGKYAEAERFHKRALAIREKALGLEHPDVVQSLNNMANLYKSQHRFAEAESLYRRSLEIRGKKLGPDHPDTATSIKSLANLYWTQGKYAKAEPLYQRALEIRQKVFGPEHPRVALSLHALGMLYKSQGRYAEAEDLYLKALDIQEEALGSDHHLDLAPILNSLGILYDDQGKFSEAERLHKQALALRESALGPEHRDLAQSLNNLAGLYGAYARWPEAERLYKRALAIKEKALGLDSPDLALALHNLALLYDRQNKPAEAEPLYQRALNIWEKTLGPEHPLVALCLNNLAIHYHDQGKYDEAERLHKRSLAIREKTFGPGHPDVALSLNNLANLYGSQDKHAEAEQLHRRALSIREKALGPEHPDVAQSLNNLANHYRAQGRYGEAEPLFRRALKIWEVSPGPKHPDVVLGLNNLAHTLAGRQKFASARPLYERARLIQLDLARANADLDDEALRGLLGKGNRALRRYADLLAAIARDPTLDPSMGRAELEAFVVVEQARGGAAQAALARSGARAAAGDPETAHLARRVQDLRNRRQELDKRLAAAYGKSSAEQNAERLKSLQETAQQLDRDLSEAVARLNRAFPKYAELASPEPIKIAALRKMLRSGEALISYFTLDKRLLVWLVRPDEEPVYQDIEMKRADLVKMVSRVRVSLEQSGKENLKAGLFSPFDVEGSNALYKLLLEPLKEHLHEVKHLILVPDEVLLPLPFGTLVTEAEGEPYRSLADLYTKKLHPSPKELTDYAKLAWLAKDYAITILPSATSLRAFRQIARSKRAEVEPFIGFGDPVLEGEGERRGGNMLASRGGSVVVDDLRKLDRLPDTRRELLAIAQVLGTDPSKSLYLGEKATEPVVQQLNRSGRLGRAQVVSFATHGLIGGELKGLQQPALVLTPPEKPSKKDDGLLDLEDILGLKLNNAEWVILSACNTAAADGSNEGLSGLVRAFFFAGARSLLVSHWSVDDRATRALMTENFRRYARDKTAARSEVLRQGMLALMAKAKGKTAYFAHPFAWAAFFLVGEGSAGTN